MQDVSMEAVVGDDANGVPYTVMPASCPAWHYQLSCSSAAGMTIASMARSSKSVQGCPQQLQDEDSGS